MLLFYDVIFNQNRSFGKTSDSHQTYTSTFILIHSFRHIALFMLFLLTGTLAAEITIAMHGFSVQADEPAHAAKANMFCAAGFLISNDTSPVDDPLLQENESPSSSPENGMMVTSNCHSSLQLLSSIDFKLFVPEKSLRYHDFIQLGSPQTFVFEITDPPRHG